MRGVLIALDVAVSLLTSLPTRANDSLKEGAREVGEGFKKMGQETGQAIKEGGKEVGQGLGKMGKTVGQEAKEKGRSFGEWLKETGKKTGESFRQIGIGIRDFSDRVKRRKESSEGAPTELVAAMTRKSTTVGRLFPSRSKC